MFCVQAGVQMLVILRASCRRPTCCIGMAHSNHGITLLFTGSCGRSGLYQTPLEDSLLFDLIRPDWDDWDLLSILPLTPLETWSAHRDTSFYIFVWIPRQCSQTCARCFSNSNYFIIFSAILTDKYSCVWSNSSVFKVMNKAQTLWNNFCFNTLGDIIL